MGYTALSAVYDRFTRDVDYPTLARYVAELLRRNGVTDGILLDLACGTGTLSLELAGMGFDVIGADSSEEMLSEAWNKLWSMESQPDPPPQFICQDMRRLDLFGTVRACVSTQDSMNHVTEPEELSEAFRRVSLFTEPGGVFVFDMNTPARFAAMDGETYVDEDESALCIWRVAGDGGGLYEYTVDVFLREKQLWRRESEVFFERAYEPREVLDMLKDAGFASAEMFGERSFGAPAPDEKRIFFVARK